MFKVKVVIRPGENGSNAVYQALEFNGIPVVEDESEIRKYDAKHLQFIVADVADFVGEFTVLFEQQLDGIQFARYREHLMRCRLRV